MTTTSAATTTVAAATATTAAPVPAVVASLDEVERQFAAGNYLESCRLLWEATEATFLMLGKAHGLDTGDKSAIAHALDEKYELELHYVGLLIAGRLMRDHAEMDVLEYYDLVAPHDYLPEFIRQSYAEFANDYAVPQ